MREDFLKNYLGSELDPLWLETVSMLTAKGWKNFVARDKDRIKELRAQIRTLVTDTGLDAARTLVATEQARPSRRRESFRFFNCVAWRWCGDDCAKPSWAPKTMRITMSRTRFDQSTDAALPYPQDIKEWRVSDDDPWGTAWPRILEIL